MESYIPEESIRLEDHISEALSVPRSVEAFSAFLSVLSYFRILIASASFYKCSSLDASLGAYGMWLMNSRASSGKPAPQKNINHASVQLK